jgi:hypothetical protein
MAEHSTCDDSGTTDGPAMFAPVGVEVFVAALERLAGAARTGSAPPRLDELAPFGAADICTLHDSLVREG